MSPEIQGLLDAYRMVRPGVFAALPALLLSIFAMIASARPKYAAHSRAGATTGARST